MTIKSKTVFFSFYFILSVSLRVNLRTTLHVLLFAIYRRAYNTSLRYVYICRGYDVIHISHFRRKIEHHTHFILLTKTCECRVKIKCSFFLFFFSPKILPVSPVTRILGRVQVLNQFLDAFASQIIAVWAPKRCT